MSHLSFFQLQLQMRDFIMGYFATESALLPKGAMSQVLGGCKTDTVHIEKLRKREADVWFTSRT